MPSERIFVMAPTYRRFEGWCHSHDINPKTPWVTYVRQSSDLHGQVNAWFKDLGTTHETGLWWYDMIEFYQKTRGFKEIPCLSVT